MAIEVTARNSGLGVLPDWLHWPGQARSGD